MKRRYKDIAFSFDERTGQCCVMLGVKESVNGEFSYTKRIDENNPRAAFNIFISCINNDMWDKFLDELEKSGRNRYTGELK